jgi:MarR family transcriptional regulator for hemolysin
MFTIQNAPEAFDVGREIDRSQEITMASYPIESTPLPPLPSLEDQFLVEMGKARRRLATSISSKISSVGLTRARARTLSILYSQVGLTQTSVAAYLEIEGPTAVRLIDELEKAGFVQRQPDPHDRRIKKLVLTEPGREMAEYLKKTYHEIGAQALRDLSEESKNLLVTLMKSVIRNLET